MSYRTMTRNINPNVKSRHDVIIEISSLIPSMVSGQRWPHSEFFPLILSVLAEREFFQRLHKIRSSKSPTSSHDMEKTNPLFEMSSSWEIVVLLPTLKFLSSRAKNWKQKRRCSWLGGIFWRKLTQMSSSDTTLQTSTFPISWTAPNISRSSSFLILRGWKISYLRPRRPTFQANRWVTVIPKQQTQMVEFS